MDIQNLNTLQREELISFYSEKVAQLQFQVLKFRRTLAKRQAKEQKWVEDLTNYQQRKVEGEAALLVLSESNPYYHKIKLDVQKCEIRIMELEIRLQRLSPVQKTEKIAKIMPLKVTINYYQGLVLEMTEKDKLILTRSLSFPVEDTRTHDWNQEEDNFMQSSEINHLPLIVQGLKNAG